MQVLYKGPFLPLLYRDKKSSKPNVREHFIMTDKEGTVFHFIVEGTAISDVTKIPPEVISIMFILIQFD